MSNCVHCGKESEWGGSICVECGKKENAKVICTTIELSPKKFDDWKNYYSGDVLGENKARKVLQWGNKFYVVYSGGPGNEFGCHECVRASTWTGPTYKYSELDQHNGSGGPFYANNQLFKCDGETWVIVPYQISKFVRSSEPVFTQVSLF